MLRKSAKGPRLSGSTKAKAGDAPRSARTAPVQASVRSMVVSVLSCGSRIRPRIVANLGEVAFVKPREGGLKSGVERTQQAPGAGRPAASADLTAGLFPGC